MKKIISVLLLLMLAFGFLQVIKVQYINAEESSGCWKCYHYSEDIAWCWAPHATGFHQCGQVIQSDCVLTNPGCGS